MGFFKKLFGGGKDKSGKGKEPPAQPPSNKPDDSDKPETYTIGDVEFSLKDVPSYRRDGPPPLAPYNVRLTFPPQEAEMAKNVVLLMQEKWKKRELTCQKIKADDNAGSITLTVYSPLRDPRTEDSVNVNDLRDMLSHLHENFGTKEKLDGAVNPLKDAIAKRKEKTLQQRVDFPNQDLGVVVKSAQGSVKARKTIESYADAIWDALKSEAHGLKGKKEQYFLVDDKTEKIIRDVLAGEKGPRENVDRYCKAVMDALRKGRDVHIREEDKGVPREDIPIHYDTRTKSVIEYALLNVYEDIAKARG